MLQTYDEVPLFVPLKDWYTGELADPLLLSISCYKPLFLRTRATYPGYAVAVPAFFPLFQELIRTWVRPRLVCLCGYTVHTLIYVENGRVCSSKGEGCSVDNTTHIVGRSAPTKNEAPPPPFLHYYVERPSWQ